MTTTTEREKGVSMLDRMVKGSIDAKTAKIVDPKGTLSQLVGEQPITLVAAPAPLIPNHPVLGSLPDDPDIILGRLDSAKREVLAILESIERLTLMYGKPELVLALDAAVEGELAARELARRDADRATVASVGPQASKADVKKAEAAAARIATERPDPAAAGVARLASKADLLKAMMGEDNGSTEAVEPAVTTFARDFAAKAEAAQAATFSTDPGMQRGLDGVVSPAIAAAMTAAKEPDATPQSILLAAMAADPSPTDPAFTAAVPTGWTCPTHGGFIVRISERRKVEFRACSECNLFEKV